MLSCLNLTLTFQDKSIFKDFSLSLPSGSIYILKGPNASGKTSLLKSICGLMEATTGKVLWRNQPCSHEHLSYLGHENALKLNLSVIDNLMLWADLKDTHALIMPALGHFRLLDIAEIKCKYLSAGLQKRVALARMIISNTKLWLLDEPETSLDEHGRELLLQLLQIKISSGGIAMIATHNLTYYQNIPEINLEDFKQ